MNAAKNRAKKRSESKSKNKSKKSGKKLKTMHWIIIVALVVIFLAAIVLERRWSSGFEAPKYTVLFKQGSFEVRDYEPYVLVKMTVTGDFMNAGSIAFPTLAGYISGKNSTNQSIEMTVPVMQTAASPSPSPDASAYPSASKSAAPSAEQGYTIAFVAPSQFTVESLPAPSSEEVTISQVPKRIMAAYRYYGSWSLKNYIDGTVALRQKIAELGSEEIGAVEFARYNAPITPWFLRKNEILIPINYSDSEEPAE